ncbi:MAG: NAD(P)-binding domain-containing protein, partial [Candidatus Poribacteria bacterium]|nr:NAD(P)-binding domain-containing protein [Candidatus Poribacteria bacterium]
RPESFDGDRVVVVGGGRSADWAATELYDAQKEVHYVMRQSFERHWRLINDSRDGLPYYARIAEIIESQDPRFQTLYNSHLQKIEDKPKNGLVTVNNNGHQKLIDVDHVVIEIGGIADYSLFKGFPALRLKEKYDNYRFQVHQVETKAYSSEVTNIPNLYMGGYLAEGLGLVVIAMHPTTYTIAADILQKEGIYKS